MFYTVNSMSQPPCVLQNHTGCNIFEYNNNYNSKSRINSV